MSGVTFTVPDDDVYQELPDHQWEKYQRGFMGILNNAYNQSCNAGTKVLGDMSDITSQFEGGSYDEFLQFYAVHFDGDQRVVRAVDRMTDNLVARTESVGGEADEDTAREWAEQYIESMLVNTYRGFMDEGRAIEIVAKRLGEDWEIADASEESLGIDGYIGNHSVQVKPESHNNLDLNSYGVDMLITYEYGDDEFTVTCITT